jgi:arginine decarboxylase
MILQVSAAIGSGPTELAAFDDALLKVGAANYNLVRLSSVIPPLAVVVQCDGEIASPGGTWGDRLYVVYAEQRASRPGDEASAGVGWVQDDSGRGLFVEHGGSSEHEVRAQIEASLEHLRRGHRLRPGTANKRVVAGQVVDQPICALALCSYETAAWSTSATPHPDLRQLRAGLQLR